MAGAVPFTSRLLAQAPQDGQPSFTIRSDVRLVVLDVSVKDRSGGFVTGLSKENFQVLENNMPQPITVFAREDLPVTAGILLDESRSMQFKRTEALAAADALIVAGNPRDEVFVLNFNETVRRGLPEGQLFSDDPQQLRAALYRGHPFGRTALYDAVIAGLEQLELGQRDKKALILISDGGDNMSRHPREAVFEKLDRGAATVYTVGVYDSEDQDRSPGILKHLAGISGGEAFFPESLDDLTAVCKGIAREIRTRYTVGYVPKPSNGGPLRHLRVNVSAPAHGKLVAHARTRYRYQDPAAPASASK
jgi:Ca-activated chloride channel family protein